jgi:hypothetical protein
VKRLCSSALSLSVMSRSRFLDSVFLATGKMYIRWLRIVNA